MMDRCPEALLSVFPKVITAEFFRRDLADRIRGVAIAPGYVATLMVQGMNHKAMEKILNEVPIGRLIEPAEVANFIATRLSPEKPFSFMVDCA